MTPETIRTAIQDAMRAAFPRAESRVARFYAMQEYHLGWRTPQLEPAYEDPGKLLRPYLCLLACRIAGSDPQRALPLAAGIQLIHDFSLIHDDIEDDSHTRRGRPTVWSLWGLAQGINAGDGMFVLAHQAIQRLRATGLSAELILDVLERFDQTILTICEGQFLDLSFEGNLAVGEDDYLAMIERKTSVLIAAAAGLGALVGGAAEPAVRAMFAFGRNLGLAFQIQDDVLGIWGEPAVTGKPFAADLYRRKLSLPVIHALRAAAERENLAGYYRHGDPNDAAVAAMLEILAQAGSRSYTETMADHYHHAALQALAEVSGDPAALADLRALAARLPGRAS
jgi:geranylgeranyl diphosphate synthase type I